MSEYLPNSVWSWQAMVYFPPTRELGPSFNRKTNIDEIDRPDYCWSNRKQIVETLNIQLSWGRKKREKKIWGYFHQDNI